MPVVMLMSTDPDIVATQLDSGWPPVTTLYTWEQVSSMRLNLAGDATIVVIAHGNGEEIGNSHAGIVDINATTFLALIQNNMQADSHPAEIYISTCGPGIAQFAADVRMQAQQNQIWAGTRTYGHNDAEAGDVPPPNSISWTEIYEARLRPTGPPELQNEDGEHSGSEGEGENEGEGAGGEDEGMGGDSEGMRGDGTGAP
jgi:hypothetical protein